MLDLTCEAPRCFNIRHPERGVKTRPTSRKPGGNLHCIMAFQMQESGEWGVADDSISPEPPRETTSDASSLRSRTPIETLDSSESDFPREVGEEPSGEVGGEHDGLETLTREDAAQLCVWSDGTTSPSSSLSREREEGLVGRETEEPVEAVDSPQGGTWENAVTPVTTPQVEVTANLLADLVLLEEGEVEEELNKTLTPTKEETNRTENQPSVEIERSGTPDDGDRARSGTYRKSRSSLSPAPATVDPEGGHQLEEVGAGVMAGDYTRRSGTFRKEKPSLPTSAPQIDTAGASAGSIAMETDTVDPTEESRTEGVLQMESLITPGDAEVVTSSPEELTLNQDSGLKRSTTFRKEKPTLEVSPIVRGSNSRQSSQHSDQDRDTDEEDVLPHRTRSTEPPTQSPVVIPTVSLTLPPNSSAPVSSNEAESDDDSSEETYLLVDGDPASLEGRGVRRSGTFTKERPQDSLFGDDYF